MCAGRPPPGRKGDQRCDQRRISSPGSGLLLECHHCLRWDPEEPQAAIVWEDGDICDGVCEGEGVMVWGGECTYVFVHCVCNLLYSNVAFCFVHGTHTQRNL